MRTSSFLILGALLAISFGATACEAPTVTEGKRSVGSHLVGGGDDGAVTKDKAPVGTDDDAPPIGTSGPGALRLIPMHMQWDDTGDWLMSRTAGEGAPQFHYNGVEFRALETPSSSMASVPLYRCLDAHGTHYQSVLFACESEGSRLEGLLGYVYQDDPGDGAKELWRCIAPSGRPIITTIVPENCDNAGYIRQYKVGYGYPASFGQP